MPGELVASRSRQTCHDAVAGPSTATVDVVSSLEPSATSSTVSVGVFSTVEPTAASSSLNIDCPTQQITPYGPVSYFFALPSIDEYRYIYS
jgi:hypothetical protein